MKKITTLLVTLVIFTSCIGDIFNSKTPEKDVEYQIVRVEERYKMRVPRYMRSTEILNDIASLQYMNDRKEAYVIVIDEFKTDLQAYFDEVGTTNTPETFLKNYRDFQIENFEGTLLNFKLIDEAESEVNGMKRIVTKIEGITEGVNIAYTFGFFEGKETIYAVICWTLQEYRERYSLTYKTMLASLFEIR